jgi:hypothetical protein
VTVINPRITGQIQANTNFERNTDYPHIANQGNTGLTDGEGCYGCQNRQNGNSNGRQGSAGQEFGGFGNTGYGNSGYSNPNYDNNFPSRRLRSKRDTREWNNDEVEDFLGGFRDTEDKNTVGSSYP